MKSLRSLISWSALVLMAGLLVGSALVYAVSEVLLHRFVDGQLFALAETLADIVERHPELIDRSSPDGLLPQTCGDHMTCLKFFIHFESILQMVGYSGKVPMRQRNLRIPADVLQRVERDHAVFQTVGSTGVPADTCFCPARTTVNGATCYRRKPRCSAIAKL